MGGVEETWCRGVCVETWCHGVCGGDSFNHLCSSRMFCVFTNNSIQNDANFNHLLFVVVRAQASSHQEGKSEITHFTIYLHVM